MKQGGNALKAAWPGSVLAREVQRGANWGGKKLLILSAGFCQDCKRYASVVVFIWSRSLKNAQKLKYTLAAGFSFIRTLIFLFCFVFVV